MVWKRKARTGRYIHHSDIIDECLRVVMFDQGDQTVLEASYYPEEVPFLRWYADRFRVWRMNRTEKDEAVSKFIKKALAKAKKPKGPTAAHDPQVEKDYPAIHEFMTCMAVDGKPRLTSSLSIFTQEGYWKCCLNDKDSAKVLWASGESLQALLVNLESRLTADDPEWKDQTAQKPRGKK